MRHRGLLRQWRCLSTLWDRKYCGDKAACYLETRGLFCFVFISANGVFIWEELTTCFAAASQERSWICCRGRMLFDELQLKFNEGKFVSAVSQSDLGSLLRVSVQMCVLE